MNWRFLPFRRYEPYFKTGLNQAILESVADGADPVVFLSGWDQKCVNVGRSQTIENEIDLEEVKKQDIAIVRRQGGGGTTYLTPDGEITWGIVAPEDYFPENVNKIYQDICGVIAESMTELDIEAEHQPINDVVTNGKKISGSTLRKENNTVYMGGTLLYNVDVDEMFSVLTPDEDKLKDKQIKEFKERVTSISRETDASFDEARESLKKYLLKGRNWEKSRWSENEIKRAKKLADKYASDEWLYRK